MKALKQQNQNLEAELKALEYQQKLQKELIERTEKFMNKHSIKL